MLGVTIGVGKWRRAAELTAQAAHTNTGLETRVLGDAEWATVREQYEHPSYLRLHLFDFVEDDDVLYFDADAIHLRPWNPREFAGRPELIAAVDRCVGEEARKFGLEPNEYFNAGVMILNRQRHEPMLRMAQRMIAEGERFEFYWEQTPLNLARKRCGIPLLDLGPRFNRLRFNQEDEAFDGHRHRALPPAREAIRRRSKRSLRAIQSYSRRTTRPGWLTNSSAKCQPTPPKNTRGRGIVICAGGVRYLTCGLGAHQHPAPLGLHTADRSLVSRRRRARSELD